MFAKYGWVCGGRQYMWMLVLLNKSIKSVERGDLRPLSIRSFGPSMFCVCDKKLLEETIKRSEPM